MINPAKIVKNIIGKDISKNRKMLSNVEKTIGTAKGKAHYIGTETEDEHGRWNDDYYTKDGYWVIHKGKHHHVYENDEKEL